MTNAGRHAYRSTVLVAAAVSGLVLVVALGGLRWSIRPNVLGGAAGVTDRATATTEPMVPNGEGGLGPADEPPAPPPAPPPIHPSNFVVMDDPNAEVVTLHPSWCAPHPQLPFAPFALLQSPQSASDPDAPWPLFYAAFPRDDPEYPDDDWPADTLRVAEGCRLAVPQAAVEQAQAVCLVRHNALVRCASVARLKAGAAAWPLELMPAGELHPACAVATDGVRLADPSSPDFRPLALNVFGLRVPFPSFTPRSVCGWVNRELDLTYEARSQISLLVGDTAPVARLPEPGQPAQ